MPETQQKLSIQQQQLRGLRKTLQGTILAINLHSALLNDTVYALSKLSHVVEVETNMRGSGPNVRPAKRSRLLYK